MFIRFSTQSNCHDALKAHMQQTNKNQHGAIVEIDIRKYFNTIPHAALDEILKKKIIDKRFLTLIKSADKGSDNARQRCDSATISAVHKAGYAKLCINPLMRSKFLCKVILIISYLNKPLRFYFA